MLNNNSNMSRVALVVLNWNAAQETIECLANVFSSGFSGSVVLADNDSQDGSTDLIRAWADRSGHSFYLTSDEGLNSKQAGIFFLRNASNFGFAGGNNPAIRFAFESLHAEYVWLLNNDARVNEKTLNALVDRCDSASDIGFVGSVICHYDEPKLIQCYGGMVVHKWLGLRSLYMKNRSVDEVNFFDSSKVDALMGASLLIRKEVYLAIGLMSEEYFMYAEEVDWQLRAKETGWKIAVANESYVFHKGALSTASNGAMYYYYLYRSSVMFTKRFFPVCVVTAVFFIVAMNFRKNIFKPRNFFFGVKGVVHGLLFKW